MGFSKAQERLKANSHTELKYQLRETKPLDSGQLIEKLKLYASRKQV